MEARVACLGLKTAINTSAQYKFERFCQNHYVSKFDSAFW